MSAFTHNLDQVTYPRMERQDLTQAQLGSFKFVPTDEVRPAFSAFSPPLTRHNVRPFNIDTQLSRRPPDSTIPRPDDVYPVKEHPPIVSSPTRFDSTFFDTFIKPDLANSRLLLGPNALRAAVDRSPTSPQKQALKPATWNTAAPTDAIKNKMSPSYTNHMNRDTDPFPEFNPSSTTMAPAMSMQETNLLHTSLIRALAAEQRAHETTSDALEEERIKRIHAEAEAKKHMEHVRSLNVSINMLKSVIQHNIKKKELAVQQSVVDNYYGGVQRAGPPQTIIYDAVEELKNRNKINTIKPQIKPAPLGQIDDRKLFNLDLLETHGSPLLRRQFSNQVAVPEQQAVSNLAGEGQLVNLSPSKDTKREKSDDTWESGGVTLSCSPVEAVSSNGMGKLNNQFDTVSKLMAMPFDPHVQWAQDPIFENSKDKFNRLRYDASVFAEHPVRYHPDKSDTNLYRTVMIDFLPVGTTYKNVLDHIQGGTVESIQLYGPVGHSTTFMTARIVFTYELGARSVYMYGQEPGMFVQGKKVRVWQVLEPTYPRSEELSTEIFDDLFTRYLLIENAPESSLAQLPEKLKRQLEAGFVINIGTAHDGLPMIEFTSIIEASKALKQLMSDPAFGGSRFDFEADPCSAPY